MGRESPVYLSESASPSSHSQHHRNSLRSQELFYTSPSLFLQPQASLLAPSPANEFHVWSPMAAAASFHAHSPFTAVRGHSGLTRSNHVNGGSAPSLPTPGHLTKGASSGHNQPWSSALLSAYMMHLLPVTSHSSGVMESMHNGHCSGLTDSPRNSGGPGGGGGVEGAINDTNRLSPCMMTSSLREVSSRAGGGGEAPSLREAASSSSICEGGRKGEVE